MECPYCGREMNCEDYYGLLASHQSGEVHGYIYKCYNSNGFENGYEAIEYLKTIGETLESLNVSNYEDLTCENAKGNGYYYTDKNDNLHEGYPC